MPTRRDPGPSVKDKELYEALRDEGNSKQKSATDSQSGRGYIQKRGW